MMSRRCNGEGSITRRKDGRWMGRYTIQTADGPKQKAVYGKTRGGSGGEADRRDGGAG
jgi:integrase